MESALDWHRTRALLEWQIELGVDEALCDAPIDRFAAEAALREAAKTPELATSSTPAAPPVVEKGPDPVQVAEQMAAGAADLDALRSALDRFEHCELRKGARNLVFGDGQPGASVMIIGEAPGRDEDLAGKPFVGPAGQLLDNMLGAIGLSRAESVYITNVVPWRPPQNRDPKPDEIAMMQPFLHRHIALANPDLLVIVGDISAQALLGKRGIIRLRGQWTTVEGRPALPMVHPDYLLRTPLAKREAWADLLEIRARLAGGA